MSVGNPMDRLTLAAFYQDKIAKSMLKANVPRFFWYDLLTGAGMRSALGSTPSSAMGITPERSPKPGGDPVPSLDEMSLTLNDTTGAFEVVKVSDDLSQDASGQTVKFLRPKFSGGGYTIDARRRLSTTTLSTTPITPGVDSVFLTLNRLNGPYASGGSTPQPYAVDVFDAKRSNFDVGQYGALQLEYDRRATVDGIMNALVDSLTGSVVDDGSTNYILPGEGLITAQTSLATPGDYTFNLETLLRAQQTLEDRSVPRMNNGRYVAVITPKQALQLELDGDYKNLSKYYPEKNPLFKSFVADLGTIIIFRSATLTKDTATVSGNTIHHGVMFGSESIGYGVGEECNVIASTDDNYGNTAKFMWQAIEAYGGLNNNNCVGMRSD